MGKDTDPLNVWCPTCGARTGQGCTTSAYNATKPHKQRLRKAGVLPATSRPRRSVPARVRANVRRRSRGQCEARWEDGERCRRRSRHLHHVIRSGRGGPDVEENLMDLCWPCHDAIHVDINRAKRLGMLRPPLPVLAD